MNKWLVVAFIVFFGGIGSYFLYLSHADSTQVPCVSIGSGKYNCTFYQLPTPIVNGSNASVGTFKYSHTNWITCQQTGREVTVGAYHNKWWGWTLSDQNTWGWVNAVYGQGGVNDGSYSAAPNCNGAHGAPPQPVVTAAPAPAPKPAPTPAPTTASSIVAYTGSNDGCGGNATHYNGTIHVGQTNYGTGSVCKCNTGKILAYATVYQSTTPNPGCGTTTVQSAPSLTSTKLVAYTGDNDGCGGNATHYNGTTHVGQTNYGTDSVCKCNSGQVVAYGAVYQSSAFNPACASISSSQVSGQSNLSSVSMCYANGGTWTGGGCSYAQPATAASHQQTSAPQDPFAAARETCFETPGRVWDAARHACVSRPSAGNSRSTPSDPTCSSKGAAVGDYGTSYNRDGTYAARASGVCLIYQDYGSELGTMLYGYYQCKDKPYVSGGYYDCHITGSLRS